MTVSSVPRQTTKPFPPGVHAPTVTFFLPDGDRQEIDWETQERHLEFLVKSGIHGSKFTLIYTIVCHYRQTGTDIKQL